MAGFGLLKIAAAVFVVLGLSVGGAFALGVVGTPTVESVENHFSDVSNETTGVRTTLLLHNPNPDFVGSLLGSTSVEYTVAMNGVRMASGNKSGLALEQGNTSLDFSTRMRNGQIPPWWHTHIENGERTQVTIDADVSSSLVGGRSISVQQDKEIETDIIGQFNSTETRPIESERALLSNPLLYVNETRGQWDQGNLTQAETPMKLDFTVFNPKPYPYTITKIGYEITMNDVTVGEGETDRGYTIGPGQTKTLGTTTAIENENLDEWWVTHLERNQVTDLYIDFYLIVEAGGERFRVDLRSLDYSKTIETDVFGNKGQYPTGANASADGDADADGGPDDGTDAGTPTPTETATDSDGGLFGDDGETATQTPTDAETPTEEASPAEPSKTPIPPSTGVTTETDDGLLALGR
ncbi:LEA type 2 family protein [Haloarcula nitratireducens]|uniref:Water stress and hypersensitive response domain-containing protein n=1 Tax=Haloarcula nitratireducens TaxID=2487749 RepID=A0AAW4P8Q3_9EURY|nr:LEA type 2 family protein [Halomicroarcula nitratireducens]MBX0294244.1 hypothetical protein [Halomicroarcula nitratireducens]